MRNLTITRLKSFVACAVAMKVYIEDPDSQELTIDGIPCRRLGKLKNGETAVFPIPEREARIYVIADKASRNYCNDYYPIPAGTGDVTITGKNKFNPFLGNPFRFDGITDPEILGHRKKGNKKAAVVMAASIVIGLLVGIGSVSFRTSVVKPQEFSASGMTITLNNQFKKTSYEGFTQCFESKSVLVMTLQEPFTLMDGLEDYTLEEYSQAVMTSNGRDPSTLKQEKGVMYFDYTAKGSDSADYYYCVTLHKAPDAFWVIQFATPVSNQNKLHDQFLTWAADITFG